MRSIIPTDSPGAGQGNYDRARVQRISQIEQWYLIINCRWYSCRHHCSNGTAASCSTIICYIDLIIIRLSTIEDFSQRRRTTKPVSPVHRQPTNHRPSSADPSIHTCNSINNKPTTCRGALALAHGLQFLLDMSISEQAVIFSSPSCQCQYELCHFMQTMMQQKLGICALTVPYVVKKTILRATRKARLLSP